MYIVRSGFKGRVSKDMSDPVKVSRIVAKMVCFISLILFEKTILNSNKYFHIIRFDIPHDPVK